MDPERGRDFEFMVQVLRSSELDGAASYASML